MAYGLRIWGPDGALWIDTATRNARYLGSAFNIGGSGTSGAISSAGFATGTPWWSFLPILVLGAANVYQPPSIWMDGNTIRWQYGNHWVSNLDLSQYGHLIFGVH